LLAEFTGVGSEYPGRRALQLNREHLFTKRGEPFAYSTPAWTRQAI
jgi:hypothetical protein